MFIESAELHSFTVSIALLFEAIFHTNNAGTKWSFLESQMLIFSGESGQGIDKIREHQNCGKPFAMKLCVFNVYTRLSRSLVHPQATPEINIFWIRDIWERAKRQKHDSSSV